MDVCKLLLVRTTPIRLIQQTAPTVLAATVMTLALIQQPMPVVLVETTAPTLLIQAKGGPEGPPGPPGTPDLVVAADCSAAEAVGDLVYVDSASGSTPDVRKVDPDDAATMPAVGIIVSKPTATTAQVQMAGTVALSGLTPGPYWVGTDSKLATSRPANPGSGVRALQIVGHAYSEVDFYIAPNLAITRVLPT